MSVSLLELPLVGGSATQQAVRSSVVTLSIDTSAAKDAAEAAACEPS